ncbi:preprotein translocase subunit YajC [Streptomyces sp. B1866]|uniref:preprotein translocase subunit YajC n=1 Tax=Streptomyces sp. B1866 TaxID=3075431 RepID=UPI002890D87D|nr:preprotein translocase subunit YajC [Streptomyces sp. B1866]MDT3398986.1 preprotein translocase subunit YajC [Streptomyces sp. B1866]
MNIVTLLPFVVLIGAMFLMTRSAKNKQRQAAAMRDQLQPGTGVRTIGGMYATVKEVHEDALLLEVAPGVHAFYAKTAVGAVLEDAEYNRIVHGIDPDDADAGEDADAHADDTRTADAAGDGAPVVPDDASSLVDDAPAGTREAKKTDLGKADAADEAGRQDGGSDAK